MTTKILFVVFFLSFLSLMGGRYAMGYWESFLWLPFFFSFASLTAILFINFKNMKRLLSLRTTKMGMSLGLALVLVFSLLVVTNLILQKQNTILDLSLDERHSLSSFSKELLDRMPSELKILVFYTQQDEPRRQKVEWLLAKYENYSEKVDIEYIDPVARPDLQEKYKLKQSAILIFQYKEKQSTLKDKSSAVNPMDNQALDEQAITSTIMRLMREESKSLYFIKGHGEKDLRDSSEAGLKNFVEELQNAGYKVDELRLLESDIPKDNDLLLIVGPRLKFIDKEIEILKSYLQAGGSLFMAIDPGMRHSLARFTKLLGIEFRNDYILDLQAQIQGANAAVSIGSNYSKLSPITEDFPNDAYTLFPLASSLSIDPSLPENIKVLSLLSSGENSFTKFEISEKVELNPEKDRKGPHPIAMLSSGTLSENPYKAVVFSDSDFLGNQFFTQVFNQDLAMNAVSYLLDQKEEISIRPKNNLAQVLLLTQTQGNLIVILYIGYSLMLLLFSIFLWIRSRRKS